MGSFPLANVDSGKFPYSYFKSARIPLLAVGAGFLMLVAAAVLAADAKTITQNQRCAPIASSGASEYDTSVECTFDIARPASDTSSDAIRVGIFAPEAQPGVTSWTIPGFTCAADGSRDGVKRTTCTGNLSAGATVNASIRVHLLGQCGSQTAIGTQVNQNNVLSEFQNTVVTFPACGSAATVSSAPSSSISSSRMSSSASSRSSGATATTYQCSDGVDNDGDGTSDYFDSNCSGPYDNDESQGSGFAQQTASLSTQANATSSVPFLLPQTTEVGGYMNHDTLLASGSPNFTGSVTMDKIADRNEGRPGDSIVYTITVRNNSSRSLQRLNLIDRFTRGDYTVIDAGGGLAGSDTIEWMDGNLQPFETKTIRYQVRLSETLSHGATVQNTVTLSGGDLSRPITATTSIGIMRSMPSTGAVRLKPLFGNW